MKASHSPSNELGDRAPLLALGLASACVLLVLGLSLPSLASRVEGLAFLVVSALGLALVPWPLAIVGVVWARAWPGFVAATLAALALVFGGLLWAWLAVAAALILFVALEQKARRRLFFGGAALLLASLACHALGLASGGASPWSLEAQSFAALGVPVAAVWLTSLRWPAARGAA